MIARNVRGHRRPDMLNGFRRYAKLQPFNSLRSLQSTPLSKTSIEPKPRSTTTQTENRVIFSGIQPTGVPHLGNYLGALQQWKHFQDEASPWTQLLFSVVDLHAITVQQDPNQLRAWKRETLAALLAVGLDPERCIIFNQSTVSFL